MLVPGPLDGVVIMSPGRRKLEARMGVAKAQKAAKDGGEDGDGGCDDDADADYQGSSNGNSKRKLKGGKKVKTVSDTETNLHAPTGGGKPRKIRRSVELVKIDGMAGAAVVNDSFSESFSGSNGDTDDEDGPASDGTSHSKMQTKRKEKQERKKTNRALEGDEVDKDDADAGKHGSTKAKRKKDPNGGCADGPHRNSGRVGRGGKSALLAPTPLLRIDAAGDIFNVPIERLLELEGSLFEAEMNQDRKSVV